MEDKNKSPDSDEEFEREFLKDIDWDEEKKRFRKWEESIGITDEDRKIMRESLSYKSYLINEDDNEPQSNKN